MESILNLRPTRLLIPFSGGLVLATITLAILALAGGSALAGTTAWYQPPEVVVIHPPAASHTATLGTSISATYNQPMSATTASYQSFAVHAMSTGWLTETLGVQTDTVVLMPSAPLKPGEWVMVSATTMTLGLTGEAPLTPTVWTFRAKVWNGSGVLVDSGQSLGMDDSRAAALGDLDGDGDLDAFVPIYSINDTTGAPNQVWFNDGLGTFTDSGQALGDRWSVSASLGDLDGDGDLDAFVANGGNGPFGNKVWINDGAGSFSDSGQDLGNSRSPYGALGDLDGDGDLDVFVANRGDPNEVWINDGTGTLIDSGQSLGSATSFNAKLGDLDGDGDLDAFVANGGFSAEANKVWLNDGSGLFSPCMQDIGFAHSGVVDLGDLDSDGDLDAFVTNFNEPSGEADVVWENQGACNFTVAQALPVNVSVGVSLGDVDGDGDLDAYVGTSGGIDQLWLNQGGLFSDSGQILGTAASVSGSLVDLDGDGDLDAFVVAGRPAGPNQVWLNQNPITDLTLDGSGSGLIQTPHAFTAMVNLTATTPVTFSWQVTGQEPLTRTGGVSDTASFTWNTPGLQSVQVTADNGLNSLTTTRQIDILPWASATPVPTITSFHGFAQCEDDLDGFYVIGGGVDVAVPTDKVYHYDVVSDTWTSLAPLPAATFGHATTCYRGKIYSAGGWLPGPLISDQFYIYDVLSNTWTTGPALPRSVWGAALGAWQGKLFLAGGSPDPSPWTPVDVVNLFDIAQGEWESLPGAPMPTAASFPGWVQAGFHLYVAGGFSGDFTQNISTTQRLNLATGLWESGPDFASGRAAFPLVATEAGLYAIGGDSNGGTGIDPTTLVETLDWSAWPASGWTDSGLPLPSPRLGNSGACTMAASGGEIWSVGGLNDLLEIVATSQYSPAGPCFVLQQVYLPIATRSD